MMSSWSRSARVGVPLGKEWESREEREDEECERERERERRYFWL